MIQDFKLTKEDKIFILLFAGLILLYVLPMLIANCPYNDDFSRILKGNSWDDDGRLLPSIIVRFLVHSTSIFDPAPLPLIMSVPIFTFGGFMIKRLFIDVDSPYISAIIAMGFVFNPYLVRLFVYQLDSIGLSLSLVLLIIPFTLAASESSKKKISYYAKCILCIFLSMNSYQASLGFFMSLAVIELVHSVYKNQFNGIFKTLLSRVIQLVVAFTAYKLFLKLFFIANIARRAVNAKTLNFSDDSISAFFDNCQRMISAIFDSLSQQQTIILAVLLIISILFVVNLYKKNITAANISTSSKTALLLIVLAPLIIFAFSFVHMAFLKGSSRIMLQVLTSFSGLTAFLLLVPSWAIKNKKILCWLIVPVMLSAYGFSYIAGNLVKIEYDFQQPTISSIVSEINDTLPDNRTRLYYSGHLPRSNYFKRIIKIFPMVSELDTNTPWGFKYRLPYLGCALAKENYQDIDLKPLKTKIDTATLPIINSSYYYNLYKYNSDLLLIFK
ncbi:glucosyltransferase domain-containing protein [Desulfovibrio sp. UCD-KL4C]|uniref:glucosyltransferase domain-containing protein n=1 Tax=Desulfovibrio sp. UCD-KL4C TaxID=2578120 RepID=UPI0025BA4130|nr:glucosyltransferase domain-containing protein [Desulfovibrio sp. UCD-KL4C]